MPAGATNPPIGAFGRQYGSDPATVATHAAAFAAGLADAGVIPTAKHFPGLGRVSANTDVSSGVTDRVTTRTDPYLGPVPGGDPHRPPVRDDVLGGLQQDRPDAGRRRSRRP